jgi:putative ABC transport system permease protein
LDDDGKQLPADKVLEYRPDKRFEIADGSVFHARKFEAVIGSEIPKLTGLTIGSKFKATHGLGTERSDEHETEWTVVGILAPTHTANDRVLFIPLVTFYAISGHGEALGAIQRVRGGADPSKVASPTTSSAQQQQAEEEEDVSAYFDDEEGAEDNAHHDHAHGHFSVNKDGTIDLDLPKDQWLISAILVESRGGIAGQNLMYAINNRDEAMAVSPAMTMREFFDNFLKNTTMVLLVISLLVTFVAAVSILVSIYNSVSARKKEIAILRALGATRRRILTLICVEAGLVGLIGGFIGFIGGHLAGAAQSYFFQKRLGQSINWVATDRTEGIYLLCVIALAVLAGLVPALKAYRTPVATNLVAG